MISLRLHPREWIRWLEAQLAAARQLHEREYEGNTLGNLGNAYADLDEPRRATEFYEQSLVVKREIGDRRGEGNSLWNLAVAWDQLGDRAQAIACAEAALPIYEAIESPYAAEVRKALAKWR